jgi:hypothetical protein
VSAGLARIPVGRRPLLAEADEVLSDDGTGFAMSVLELLGMVEEAPADWLIEGLWPQASYGVIGAEDKAGKTWAALDLAVSVATGTDWHGRFPCSQGGVLALLGEGGERAFHRRLEAICASKGVLMIDLEGRLRLRLVPTDISSADELRRLSFELSENPPAVVILDPLYLSMGDAKSSDLYGMGKVLRGLQVVCRRVNAALVVVTHWNKTGQGNGANRFTGVGPGAWGRVLASVAVESRAVDRDGRSTVTLGWEITGGEIADTRFRVRRRVRAADPLDLTSPLEYEVDVADEGEAVGGEGPNLTQQRVLAALAGSSAVAPLTVRLIGDALARDGKGMALKERTIQIALSKLQDAGRVQGADDGAGTPRRWWV